MIDLQHNLTPGTYRRPRCGRLAIARLLVKVCLITAGVVLVDTGWGGSQAMAQPIFRTPRQPHSTKPSGLQLTGPGESKMAPIKAVGLGKISSPRFQLPQTGQTPGFFPPSWSSSRSESFQEPAADRERGPALREVGVDGSFLPVDRVDENDRHQTDETFDMPGIDISGLGFDTQEQYGDGSRGSLADESDLEQLPLSLEEAEAPQRRTDNVRREQIVENYPNGQPRLLRTVALDREGNYYNDGPWVVKDRDGKVVAAGTYRKGVMQGQWARRHTPAEGGMFVEKPFTLFQGPFDSIASFKAGKLDGQWIVYDRAKRSIFEIGYENGIREGLATWFYPDTTKMRQATFKQGVLDGEVVEWDEDGRLVSKEYYREGRKLIRNTSFYRPKVPKEESYFLDVKLRQNGLDNWWEAKPAPYLASGDRVQNGQARGWYPNRQLQYQGQFRNDKPVGRFFWWHENGNRSSVGQFNRTGDRSGRWIWWHDNGMKRIEGEYKDAQPTGVWRSWDKTGKLIKNKDYNNLSTEDGNLNAEQLDDQDDFLGVSVVQDDDSVEGLLEGITEDDPASQPADDDAESVEETGPAIGSGLSNGEGFLPLPDNAAGEQGQSGAGDAASEPLQQPSMESIPSAMDGESLGDESLGGDFANQGIRIRNVSTQHERLLIDRQSAEDQQRLGASEGLSGAAGSVDDEIVVIEDGQIDEAAEAFDLGELFE